MTEYVTETGYYVLKDGQGRIGAKANVPPGTHQVPDWVDPDESYDVDSADKLSQYDIDGHYHR